MSYSNLVYIPSLSSASISDTKRGIYATYDGKGIPIYRFIFSTVSLNKPDI